jgi:hypothetical protein
MGSIEDPTLMRQLYDAQLERERISVQLIQLRQQLQRKDLLVVLLEEALKECQQEQALGVDGGRREMPEADMPANPKPQQTDEKS